MLNHHYYIIEHISFAADKKFKTNKRTNNKWILEITQFTTDDFAEIY